MTKITEVDGWTVENFYFGNAVWPSYADWRTKGNQLQLRVENQVMEYRGDATIPEIAEAIAEWKTKYHDVTTSVYPPKGESQGAFFVLGWWDCSGDLEALEQYQRDKEFSM